MQQDNICKLIFSGEGKKLSTTKFVFESDKELVAEPVVLEENVVYLATRTDGRLVIDSIEYELVLGSLYFAFVGERVFVKGAEAPEFMYISFEGARSDELFFRFGICAAHRVIGGNKTLIPFWKSELCRANEENIDLVSESVLMYTFSRLSKSERSSDDTVWQIVKFVNDNFSDFGMTLSTVAAKFGYNEKYLSHRFKEYAGVGFSKYLKNIRINHAIFLLEHGVESVRNVSILCGFDDAFYFSRVFKEATGVSPRDYLRRKE